MQRDERKKWLAENDAVVEQAPGNATGDQLAPAAA
jgi:hypothetical protein